MNPRYHAARVSTDQRCVTGDECPVATGTDAPPITPEEAESIVCCCQRHATGCVNLEFRKRRADSRSHWMLRSKRTVGFHGMGTPGPAC